MRFALVRHPPPDIGPGRCYGRLDMPLAPSGATEIARIVDEIATFGWASVWTSPAMRCRTVADATGLTVRIDPRLRELNFGAWEGMAWDDVPHGDLDRWAADPLGFAPPGGESGADLIARVCDVYAAIRASGEDCAIVSHGGPLRLLAALIQGEPPNLLAPAPPIGSVQILTT